MPEFASSTVQVHVYRIREHELKRKSLLEHLILRYSEKNKDLPNMLQVITGGIEQGETATDAGFREMKEETGLTPLKMFVLPVVGSFYNPHLDIIEHIPTFAARVAIDAVVTLSDEHSEYMWLTTSEARKALVFPSHIQGAKVLRRYLMDSEKIKYMASVEEKRLK